MTTRRRPITGLSSMNLTVPSLVDALLAAFGFRDSHSEKTVYDRYVAARKEALKIARVLARIAKREAHVDLTIPDLPAIQPGAGDPYEIGLAHLTQFATEFAQQFPPERFGRITVGGDRQLEYSFFEVDTKSSLMTNRHQRRSTTHSIINARMQKAPANHVEKPKVATRILDDIATVPALMRQTRIITGHLVGEASEDREAWETDTRFARGMKAAAASAKRNAQRLAKGAAAIGAGTAAVLAGAAAVAALPVSAPLVAASAADPAIVLGDVVLFGWK